MNLNKLIEDKMFNVLTLFQRAFLKDVNYYCEIMGEYIFIKTYVVKKYSEVIDEESMINEINQLIDLGYISSRHRKTIFNGKFVTEKLLRLSPSFLELLTKSNKNIDAESELKAKLIEIKKRLK